MHQQTIKEIVKEIGSHLSGRFMGKIFQLSPVALVIDFGLRETGYLFISVDPSAPRVYLIRRQARELEKQSTTPMHFVQAMRSGLGGGKLLSITKDDTERIVRFLFFVEDELGETSNAVLVAQLTGRSANLLLLDQDNRITHALRPPKGEGQQVGERYRPPAKSSFRQKNDHEDSRPLEKGAFPSLSAAADDYYARRESAETFAARAKTSLAKLKKELAQSAKLQSNLKTDLAAHGNAEQHKRIGDLLLANISNARREGNKVTLKDYYSEGAPEIEIEADESISLKDAATRYFARYTKAKRATEEIATRQARLAATTRELEERKTELEKIVAACDTAALALFEGPGETSATKKTKRRPAERIPGVRRYRSSDGYEILVGRAAHTNDQLTFRLARPHDLWLHSADYPGSHVVIRNHTRNEIPHRTVIEAAQLAAKFSQAGDDSKVTVHYTLRKFLSKPKGAAPGLVRMSTVRTIVVRPGENIQRIHYQS